MPDAESTEGPQVEDLALVEPKRLDALLDSDKDFVTGTCLYGRLAIHREPDGSYEIRLSPDYKDMSGCTVWHLDREGKPLADPDIVLFDTMSTRPSKTSVAPIHVKEARDVDGYVNLAVAIQTFRKFDVRMPAWNADKIGLIGTAVQDEVHNSYGFSEGENFVPGLEQEVEEALRD